MASMPGQHQGEVQTCMGIGWVKFSQGRQQSVQQQEEQAQMPEIRCFGRGRSQRVAPATNGRPELEHGGESSAGSGSSRGRQSAAATTQSRQPHGAPVQVTDQTRAVLCAGQLSFFMQPAAAVVALSTRSRISGSSAGLPCCLQCNGLSFRVDVATALETEATQDRAIAPEASSRKSPGIQELSGVATDGAEAEEVTPKDLWQSSLKAAQAVASRAGVIVKVAGGAHRQSCSEAGATAPERNYLAETANAAGRICTQAGKIAKRSAEQVGWLAMTPWRGLGSDEETES